MRPPLIVIVAFDFYNPGDRIEPTGVYYDHLVTQGYCRPETEDDRREAGGIECAALDTSDAEKAVIAPPIKKKRGRPRKVVQ